jgi:hypothetical protein
MYLVEIMLFSQDFIHTQATVSITGAIKKDLNSVEMLASNAIQNLVIPYLDRVDNKCLELF